MANQPLLIRVLSVVALVVLISAAIIALDLHSTNNSPSDRLEIAASFYPVAYLAETIGGDKVTVTILTPPGAEPHDYDLSPQDIKAVETARILVINGAGLEPWRSKVESLIAATSVKEVVLADNLASLTETGSSLRHDPHTWLDPRLLQTEATVVSEALSASDPVNASYYHHRLEELTNKLTILDQDYRRSLTNCSLRRFVTTHEAFGYLAQEYQLEQIAVAGLSPDEEPSPTDLAKVARIIKDNHINYVFFETLVSPKLADTIASETGAKTLELNPIEGLRTADINQGKDYYSLMQDNLANLSLAMSCQP